MSKWISVGEPIVDGSRLVIPLSHQGLDRYLTNNAFRAFYDGIDLSNIHQSVLNLPAIGAIITVAIATGAEIRAPVIDKDFASICDILAEAWRDIYPSFKQHGFRICGDLHQEESCSTDPRYSKDSRPKNGDLLLFSGGLDSAASLLANQDSVEALISVWGADVPVRATEVWEGLFQLMRQFEATWGKRHTWVRTNIRSLVKNEALVEDFTGRGQGTWWMKAQHGVALLSLGAPVCKKHGYANMLIASSHSSHFSVPWGSSPITDSLIKWNGTQIRHDGYDLTRQMKIDRLLAPAIKSGLNSKLAVCFSSSRNKVMLNCCRCEKCIRTATGALAAGLPPESIGVQVLKSTFEDWMEAVKSGQRKLSSNEAFMWTDIQQALRNSGSGFYDSPEYDGYLNWIASHNFEK